MTRSSLPLAQADALRSAGPKSVLRHWLVRWAWRLTFAYLGIVLVMMALENWLVYHGYPASRSWVPPPAEQVRDLELTSADGNRIHAWYLPCPGSDRAVLYCHGNAGNLSHRGVNLPRWQQALNAAVLIFDYPGYGKSSGSPSEAGCYAAADAAYDWLTQQAHIAPERIILYGGSLGGGVATDLASRRPHRALVLARTFTSLPDTAAHIYPWLPVRLLMRNRYDNLAKIGRCHRPVFIAHGTADSIVPFSLGQRLYVAANEPKRFLPLEGQDHNDPLPAEFYRAVRQFLEEVEKGQ